MSNKRRWLALHESKCHITADNFMSLTRDPGDSHDLKEITFYRDRNILRDIKYYPVEAL